MIILPTTAGIDGAAQGFDKLMKPLIDSLEDRRQERAASRQAAGDSDLRRRYLEMITQGQQTPGLPEQPSPLDPSYSIPQLTTPELGSSIAGQGFAQRASLQGVEPLMFALGGM